MRALGAIAAAALAATALLPGAFADPPPFVGVCVFGADVGAPWITNEPAPFTGIGVFAGPPFVGVYGSYGPYNSACHSNGPGARADACVARACAWADVPPALP